ncbi:MAG: hypothetical protein RR101_13825 [Burkholderiaceae bacterium]
MPKFTVLTPLEHDGKPYTIDSTIELKRPEQIEPLIAVAAIAPLADKSPEQP